MINGIKKKVSKVGIAPGVCSRRSRHFNFNDFIKI